MRRRRRVYSAPSVCPPPKVPARRAGRFHLVWPRAADLETARARGWWLSFQCLAAPCRVRNVTECPQMSLRGRDAGCCPSSASGLLGDEPLGHWGLHSPKPPWGFYLLFWGRGAGAGTLGCIPEAWHQYQVAEGAGSHRILLGIPFSSWDYHGIIEYLSGKGSKRIIESDSWVPKGPPKIRKIKKKNQTRCYNARQQTHGSVGLRWGTSGHKWAWAPSGCLSPCNEHPKNPQTSQKALKPTKKPSN